MGVKTEDFFLRKRSPKSGMVIVRGTCKGDGKDRIALRVSRGSQGADRNKEQSYACIRTPVASPRLSVPVKTLFE